MARRRSGIYEIALFWDRTTGDLTVSVYDQVVEVEFEVPVGADEALEVFNHPFAHAFAGIGLNLDRPSTAGAAGQPIR